MKQIEIYNEICKIQLKSYAVKEDLLIWIVNHCHILSHVGRRLILEKSL